MTGARAVLGLIVVGLGTLTGPLDSSVNIAFPDITQDFAIPIAAIQWVVICYVLTYSSLMLVFGKLGDLFGYRRVFATGLAILAVAFALCGSAPSFGWLLFFRFCQGLGAALVIGCGPALATSLFAESARPRVLGAYTMMFGLGQAIGPSLGGFMVEAWGWNAVFWFRVPLAVVALLLLLTIPAPPRRQERPAFDAIGAVLLAVGLSTILLAVNQLKQPETSAFAVAGMAAIALAAFAGFVVQEGRTAEPIIRLGVFRDVDFTVLNLVNVIVNLVGFAVMLLVPYYLVKMTDLPLSLGGLVLALGALGMIVAGPLGGALIGRIPPRPIALLGGACVAGALLAVGNWSAGASLFEMVLPLVLHGFGLGLFQIAYTDIVTGTLARADRGVAGSLTMVTRTLGVVSGATALTWLFAGHEAAGTAAGTEAGVTFLAAFQGTITTAGAGLGLFLVATLVLRPRLWWRRAP